MANESNGRAVMVVGRIVWAAGDLFKGQKQVDPNTKQVKVDAQGQPKMQYGFGLAVEKSKAGEIFQAMQEEAKTIYPSGQYPPDFAWKFKDGDTGVDQNGAPFSQREGYPGNAVFGCTTSLPIKWFRNQELGNTQSPVFQINEGIKVGDFVWVQIMIKAHGKVGQGKPGLYLNPAAVLHMAYGTPIINTPSGESIFGNLPAPAMPAGATLQPTAPQGLAFPGAPAAQAMPPMGQPGFASPPVQQAPQAAPHHGVLPPQYQPQQPMAQPGFPQAPPMQNHVHQQWPQPQQPMAPPIPGMPMPGMPQFPR